MKKSEIRTERQRVASLSRRRALVWAGTTAAAVPFAALGGIPARARAHGASSWDPADANPGKHKAGKELEAWARGGTARIDPHRYPDPFAYAEPAICIPSCGMILGPCHDDLAPERMDISEGMPGLPMRMGLRVLDDACQPVPRANVDIWHCSAVGSYSSETSDAPDFCTDGQPETLAARWFRGHQNTDQRGIVWFNSCMPGWYTGRAVHVHITVRRDGPSGPEYLTTQVAFSNNLVNEICGSHPDYASHGLPDTPNDSDQLFEPQHIDQLTLHTQRMHDGVLLAWKTLAIRSATEEEVCFSGPTDEELGPLPM